MGVELQGHGNLFIWHGQIWKWGYLSLNKKLTLPLSLSFSLIHSLLLSLSDVLS